MDMVTPDEIPGSPVQRTITFSRVVDLSHDLHPGIVSQAVIQLSMSNVQSEYLYRSAMQQAVGKPAGGRPHVQSNETVNGQSKRIEGVGQFDAAPANVRKAAFYLDGIAGRQQRTGL